MNASCHGNITIHHSEVQGLIVDHCGTSTPSVACSVPILSSAPSFLPAPFYPECFLKFISRAHHFNNTLSNTYIPLCLDLFLTLQLIQWSTFSEPVLWRLDSAGQPHNRTEKSHHSSVFTSLQWAPTLPAGLPGAFTHLAVDPLQWLSETFSTFPNLQLHYSFRFWQMFRTLLFRENLISWMGTTTTWPFPPNLLISTTVHPFVC